MVCTLSFSTCPALTVLDSVGRILHSDFPAKPYTWHPAPGGREGGLQWYSTTRMEDIMMGLGEKAAPVNIARRRWELRATNAAHYDAFSECDPGRSSAQYLLMSLVNRVQTRILSTSNFPSCSSCPTLSTPIASASRERVSPLSPSLDAKGSNLILTYPLIPDPDAPPPLVTGIFTPSNAAAVWDLGCAHNDPLGDAKSVSRHPLSELSPCSTSD